MRPDDPLGGTSLPGDGAPGVSRLAPDEVHLWVASLETGSVESARQMAVTTARERQRAALFHRRQDAERFLFAHGVLRVVLAAYLKREPTSLHFDTGENGKPFLEDGGLDFNLSHSGSLALVVVTRGRRVGVDVEQHRPIPDLDAIAARVCSADELTMLADLAQEQRERAFFALWTRKEALAKATGEGIGAVFRDTIPDNDALNGWTVTDVDDLFGYAACVAAEGVALRLVRHTMRD